MKIRIDYVSNSSSSSFIVIDDNMPTELRKYDYSEWDPLVLPTENGQHEFGWQVEDYNDFWDKVNWCAIMLCSMKDVLTNDWYDEKPDDAEWFKKHKKEIREKVSTHYDEYFERFKRVLKENFNIEFVLDDNEHRIFAYIDHQSDFDEEPDNARMFETDDLLLKFLGSPNSYIHTDNDNND